VVKVSSPRLSADDRLRRRNEFDGSLVVGSRAFNLSTGRDTHMRARENAKAQFLDAQGSLREDITTHRACPVCAARETETIFVKDGFPHLRCASCTVIYVSPVVAQERLRSHHQGETSYTKVLTSGANALLDRKRFEYALDLLAEHLPTSGKLLDVGCGPGTFLAVARERGWQVSGVEFNASCVAMLREAGIEIIDKPLEDASLVKGSYACVALWDVLEHITDPRPFLATLRGLLSPGGMLLVEVPQIGSLVSRLLHATSNTFAGDTHINFFTAVTMRRLLEDAGFSVLELETFITELGTINNYLSYEDPYFGQAPPLLGCLTPEFIHENLLGSRLFVLARA
jgi:2-polyprenyl-3-methyl-5-hydroxy-6-metoxy-1,4-benzoquinol methylase